MEDEVTTEPGATDTGQALEGSEGTQTTQGAPAGGEGQSAAGTTETGPQEDTFFDPKSLTEDLLPAYKQMQASYTRKMQQLSSAKDKIEAYDAFMADPVSQLQRMAQQYGFQVAPAGQQPREQAQDLNQQPESWDQVYQKATEMAEQRVMEKLRPMLGELQKMKANSVEKTLDDIDPMWREHEDSMKENLRLYPQLATDPAKLYKVSVPDDVIMSRATQAALKKLEAKTKAGGSSGGSTTTRQPADDLSGQGPRSFSDSVEAARRALAQQGLTPPK